MRNVRAALLALPLLPGGAAQAHAAAEVMRRLVGGTEIRTARARPFVPLSGRLSPAIRG